ncbi:MAG: S8/S53 family peptidase [Firmicutes bacterium]|nr:S8/S53 family peptidase [Bacillota bacterium]
MMNYYLNIEIKLKAQWYLDSELNKYKNLSDIDIKYKSKYTSFVWLDTSKEGLLELINNENVENIDVYDVSPIVKLNAKFIPIDYTTQLNQSTTVDFLDTTGINAVKSQYGVSGEDVRVAIFESEGIINTNNFSMYGNRVISSPGGYIDFEHADPVGLIAVGAEGVANGAYIGVFTDTYLSYAILDEVASNFHILNISQGYANILQYDSSDFILDEFIQRTKLIVVKASGNLSPSNPNRRITSPGYANNVITVGATNLEGTSVENYSAYYDMYTNKKIIVAPGGSTVDPINITGSSLDLVGTSFAAPQVTGAIALMLEENWYLIAKPQSIQALLFAGASNESLTNVNIDPSNDAFSVEAGVGLMDLEKTFEIINLHNSCGYVNTSENPGLKYSVTLSLIHDDTISISHTLLKNEVADLSTVWTPDEWDDLFASRLEASQYQIILSGPNNFYIIMNQFENVGKIIFTVPTTGIYYLRVYLIEKSPSNKSDYGIIAMYTEIGMPLIYFGGGGC